MSFFRNSIRLLNRSQVPCRNFNVNTVQYAKRWVGPTFRELLHRRNKFKSIVYTARNTFPEWNYNAEIFAFGKRLNENFKVDYLTRAFIDSSYIAQEEFRQRELGVEPDLNLKDNTDLVQVGEKLISDYLQSYLYYSLPKCPEKLILLICNSLTSEENLANISSNIGTKDLILCADNKPTSKILKNVFLAVVGALNESSGEETTYNFIKDFVCTQLNQKDLTEVLQIENPVELLKNICKEKALGEPESRLLGQNAPQTVLATYHIGIYENKNLLGKGFGESIDIAIDSASLDAIYKFYGVHPWQSIFNFEVQIDSRQDDQIKLQKN